MTTSENAIELLPCPFCGKSSIKLVGRQRPYWFARCDDCGATGGLCMTKDRAHESWNARARQDAEDARRYRIIRNYYGVDLDDSDRRIYHDALDRQIDKDINEFGAMSK